MNRWSELSKMTWKQRYLELQYWWRALWGGSKGSDLLINYMPAGFEINTALGLLALLVAWTTSSWFWSAFSLLNTVAAVLDVCIAVGRRDAARRKAERERAERDAIERSNQRWPGSVSSYLDKIADDQAGVLGGKR